MANTFGFGLDSSGLTDTIHDAIQKKVVDTLRAGLVALPKGAVVPGTVIGQKGENFTIRLTAYPDLDSSAITNPLNEGVAPSMVKLGVDTMDFTVAQLGAWTAVTDLAQMQSPHDLQSVAQDKIARLAADAFDEVARDALALVAAADTTYASLTTYNLLDAKAALASLDVMPIPGAGYYCLLHPVALRGLEGEDGYSGYIDVTAQANIGALTKGAVSQYRGITFLPSTKFAPDASGAYPCYFLGKDSIGAGDVGTLSFHTWTAAGPGNELQQLAGFGVKGIIGAKAISFAETTDGAGSNAAATTRVYRIDVASGISGV